MPGGRIETVVSPVVKVVLDSYDGTQTPGFPSSWRPVYEAFDSVGTASAQTALSPGSSLNSVTSPFWSGTLGGGHNWIWNGSSWRLRQTNAGVGNGAASNLFEWPIANKLSAAGNGLTKQRQRPRRMRYTFECLVRSAADGAEIGIRPDGNGLAVANTILGYSLTASGGVWIPQRRLTSGAAVTNLASGGAKSSLNWGWFKAVYTEGDTPTLELWIDAVLVFLASGDAAMPDTTAIISPWYSPAIAAGGGGVVQSADGHMLIEVSP